MAKQRTTAAKSRNELLTRGILRGMVWFQQPSNRLHVERLREIMTVNEDRRLILFLGAGLSFGSSRRGRKGLAEYERWGQVSVDRERNDRRRGDDQSDSRNRPGGDDPSGGDVDHADLVTNDDGEPFPTWGRLKSRMRQNLLHVPGQDQSSISRFFRTSDPLDSAQLFKNIVGDANYFDFLRRQFQPNSPVDYWITPSHDELVALDLPIIFTTNYDNLIERAYAHHGMSLTVSPTAHDFIAHLNPKPERHLVKIHGTIDVAQTVVLTRDDYARARLERKRVYEHLRFDLEQTAYVFVGFSLSDPNVNMLLDDARLETGGTLPPAYTVQGKYDRATDEYYRSMGINVIWIRSWDYLPSFLRAINPKYSLETATPGDFPI